MRPFIFQGHVRGGGGSKDLPENSGLDHAGTTTVWWDSFAKGIVVYRRSGKKIFECHELTCLNSAMNFVCLSLRA